MRPPFSPRLQQEVQEENLWQRFVSTKAASMRSSLAGPPTTCPRPRTKGLRRQGPALGRQALLHPQPARRSTNLEDARPSRLHRRGRGPRARKNPAGLHPDGKRRRDRGGARNPVRDGRRRSVPPLRPELESVHAQGQPGLLPQADPALVRGTSDHRHHRPRRSAVVRVSPRDPRSGGPFGPHPLSHHAPGRGLRLPARGDQPVHGYQALSAPRARALPVDGRSQPAGRGAGEP